MLLVITSCSDTWKKLEEVQDPEFRHLAESLPDTILRSRADSTVAKYFYAYKRWKKWALDRKEVKVMPADKVHFALYLQHLGETVKSKAAVEEAANSIKWVHRTAGFQAITDSTLVRATISGLQRKLAKPKVKKEPIPSDVVGSGRKSWPAPIIE